MVAGAPLRMGFLWGLALPLFFCWGAGAPRSSAGPSISRPGPLVTTNHKEEAAMIVGTGTNSEGNFQTIDFIETSASSHISLETQTLSTQIFDRNLFLASAISEAETGETETTFPAIESGAFTKMTPSKSTVVITTPLEAAATSSSPMGTIRTGAETVRGSDLVEPIFDILCTDDSSEEVKRIIIDTLPSAHTSAEAQGLALDSSASSGRSAGAVTASRALAPDQSTPAEDLLAFSITDMDVTKCSVIQIITTATALGTSGMDLDPTGGKALSPHGVSALLDPTQAESHPTGSMTSAETLSAASHPTGETPLTAGSTSGGETTAAEPTTPHTTLVTVSIGPLEETAIPSVETTSHAVVSGAVTVSTETRSTVGEVASSSGLSATTYSQSHRVNGKNSAPSQPPDPDSMTVGSVLISRSPLPSVHPTTANSSPEANITSVETTALANMPGGKAPTTLPTTAEPTWTPEATAAHPEPPALKNILDFTFFHTSFDFSKCGWGFSHPFLYFYWEDTTRREGGNPFSLCGGDGGFLLLQLNVASPEDLTDPRVTEKLMQQLRHQLHILGPPVRVSLLRIRRS